MYMERQGLAGRLLQALQLLASLDRSSNLRNLEAYLEAMHHMGLLRRSVLMER